MATTYGVEGSGTYAVSLNGLDEVMSVMLNNTTNDITAQDTRNVLLTLWENGGGGAGEFFYTQTAPLSLRSTSAVGGIGAGVTFSNVSLQDLFDRMFFPAQDTGYTLTPSPRSIQLGGANTTTLTVTLTRKTYPINSARVIGGQASNQSIYDAKQVSIPTDFGRELSTEYSSVVVDQDSQTTYTLIMNDGSPKSVDASVSWYFPRWYGTIDLNSQPGFGENFNAMNATAQQITDIITILKGGKNDWAPVWNGSSLTSFTENAGVFTQISALTPKNTTKGSHMVLIFNEADWGSVGPSYQFGVTINEASSSLKGDPTKKLGVYPVQNRYEVIRNCRIVIKDFKIVGSISVVLT